MTIENDSYVEDMKGSTNPIVTGFDSKRWDLGGC